jgi:hypothetical protein
MNKAFWVIVAIDTLLFLFLFIGTIVQPGPSDGGREMALAFSVILPGVVIGLAVLLYVFSSSTTWRVIALFVVAGPGLLIAGIHLRSAYLDYAIAQNAAGRGYFSGQALKDMGQAVVRRDVAALRQSAPKANVNEVGSDGMTLLRLAVMEADSAQSGGKNPPSEVPIVRVLIALGAKPDSGLGGPRS